MTPWMVPAIVFCFLVVQHRSELSAPFEALPEKLIGPHWRGYLGYGVLMGTVIIYCYQTPGLAVGLNGFTLAMASNAILIAASLTWSQNREYSTRQVVKMVIVIGSAFVLGSRMSLTDCAALIAMSSATLLVFGCITEYVVRKKTDYFTKLNSPERYYRFFGLSSPNWQVIYCALLVFASLILYEAGSLRTEIYVLIVLFSMILLALTGSRTGYWIMFAVTAVATLIQFLFAGSVRGALMWLAVPAIALLLAPLVALLRRFVRDHTSGASGSVEPLEPGSMLTPSDKALSIASLGRSHETIKGANGRLALWKWAYSMAMKQPLLGHGYGGFWTAERTEEAGKVIGFRPRTAHSDYMEVLLNTGLVGVLFLLALLMGGVQLLTNVPFQQAEVVAPLVAYVILRAGFESDVTFPGYTSFSTMLFLFSLGNPGA